MTNHWNLFKNWTFGREVELLEQIIDIVKHKNRRVKECAAETLESFVTDLTQNLSDQQTRQIVNFFVNRMKSIIENSQDATEVMVCIRCYGLFSRSIKMVHGEEILHDHF